MSNILVIFGVYIGSFTVTAYRSIPSQTDSTPFNTATGEHVCSDGIAISQDLLKKNGGPFEFGEYVYIDGFGLKRVFDVMNKRHKKHIDVWVATKEEEHRIFSGYRNTKAKVWKLKTIKESQSEIQMSYLWK